MAGVGGGTLSQLLAASADEDVLAASDDEALGRLMGSGAGGRSSSRRPVPEPLEASVSVDHVSRHKDDSALAALMGTGGNDMAASSTGRPAQAAQASVTVEAVKQHKDDSVLAALMGTGGGEMAASSAGGPAQAAQASAGAAAVSRHRDDSALAALMGTGGNERAASSTAGPAQPVQAPRQGQTNDDAALASLLGGGSGATAGLGPEQRAAPESRSLAEETAAERADDERLSGLMVEPAEAARDDAALARELGGAPPDRTAAVLRRIAALKAESEQRRREDALLRSMVAEPPAAAFAEGDRGAGGGGGGGGGGAGAGLGPGAGEEAFELPVASAAGGAHLLRVRRLRGVRMSAEDPAPGSLCYFAAIGDATSVRYLCEQARRCDDRFLVNSSDTYGRTALHYAAYAGDVEVADVLLQAGADVLYRDGQERHALHVAAARGSLEVARLFVGTCLYRIRASALRRFRDARFSGVAGEDDVRAAERRAAQGALVEYLRSLEDLRYNLVLAEDRLDFTSLHYALRDGFHGCLPTMKLLLGSLFEFGDPAQTDSVMTEQRFQAQPGPTLVATLAGFLLEHQVEAVQQEHVRRSLTIRDELVNSLDPYGLAPIHYAAAVGNYRAIHLLASSGAEVGLKAEVHDPAALDAVSGQTAAAKSLTAFDLAKDTTTRQALAAYGQETLEGQASKMMSLVESNCEYVNQEWGLLARTPLHAALFSVISQGRGGAQTSAASPLLGALLKAHPECDPLVADANGWTPLHYACAYGRDAELRQLLTQAQRLHPDLRKQKTVLWPRASKENCLSNHKAGGKAETGRLSLFKPDARADPKKARLRPRAHSAGIGGGKLGGGTAARAPWKLAAGQGAAEARGDAGGGRGGGAAAPAMGALMGRTPSHVAAQGAGEREDAVILGDNGHIKCLAVLDEFGILELEAPDDRGMTPFLSACAAGATAAVRWLLDRGVDSYRVDKTRRNALHLAAAKGHRRVIRLLCGYDADTSRLRNGQDWKGRRPAELTCAGSTRSHGSPSGALSDFATIWEAARAGDVNQLDCALRAGAHVDALSPAGWTAAMYAAAGGNTAILRHLLSLRCSCEPLPAGSAAGRPQLRPPRGRGPLHLAAEAGHVDACLLLVRVGSAALEARSAEGLTPLLSACAAGQLGTLQALVDLCADPRAEVSGPAPRRSAFHVLAAEDSDRHAHCVRWLAGLLGREDPCALLELLERGDEARGLPRACDAAKQHRHTFAALNRAMREARARSEEFFKNSEDPALSRQG